MKIRDTVIIAIVAFLMPIMWQLGWEIGSSSVYTNLDNNGKAQVTVSMFGIDLFSLRR